MSQVIVRVTPRAKHEKLEVNGEVIKIWVTEPPVDNRANDRVRRVLAEHLDIPLRTLQLIRGAGSRTKVFSIED